MTPRDGLVLDQIPMPPSENQAYATDWKTGRRFASKELNEFKGRFQMWSLKRTHLLAKTIEELKWELADHRKCLRVDVWMFFQYESLFTKPIKKNERPRRKKMDVQNRIKPFFDTLASMLGIDDSRMTVGRVLPVLRLGPGQYIACKLGYEMIPDEEEIKIENAV